MIIRIWRTAVDETRADDYQRFATERSLPMFERQAGFRGLYFASSEGARTVVTLSADLESAQALARSSEYLETVTAIEAAGFLRDPQTLEISIVDRAALP